MYLHVYNLHHFVVHSEVQKQEQQLYPRIPISARGITKYNLDK